MGAPATVLSVRQRFFRGLLDLKQPTVNLSSMALGMGVHQSLLTRYLKEAVNAGWVSSRKMFGGMEITVLDRAGLLAAANASGGER